MDALAATPFRSFIERYQTALTVLGFVVFYAFLIWLYYPALDSFFANDDWVILYHNSKIPPSEWWRYFSPKTIWFYRPLQSMQFGLTYHFAGLNHRAYSLQLLIMHLVVCTLAWVFLKQLFGRALAWLATFLFSISWIYADILLWKANYNTLQHAITTLAACITFTLYLQTRKRRWMWGTIAAAVANCFTKESSVSLPLILGVVWLTVWLQARWDNGGTAASDNYLRSGWKGFVLQGWKDLWPIVVVTLVYVALHRQLIINIEPNYKPGYRFVNPILAFTQWMHGTSHSILGFLHDPILLGNFPVTQKNLVLWLETAWFIPGVLLAFAWYFKSPSAVFAILVTIVVQFPHFAMANYHASRYYYLSAIGGVVFVSAFALRLLEGLRFDSERKIASRLSAYAALVVIIYIAAVNFVHFQNVIGRDHQQTVYMQRAFETLKEKGKNLPADSMVVFYNVPSEFMNNGMGATEQVFFATKRTDLTGVAEDERLTSSKLHLLRYRSTYALDVKSNEIVMIKINRF